MRSISSKLILAFLSIGIISVAVIFVTATLNTRSEFIKFLTDQTQTNVVTQLSAYYQQYGSWEGVERVLSPDGDEPGMGPGHMEPGPNGRFYPYTLTTPTGIVIVPNGRYKHGDQVPQADLAKGISITKDDKVIGVLVPIPAPFQGRPREVEFIEQTNRILLYGALIGAVIALLLGIFLSRTLTRPIRELTQATHAVSEGDLSQQVRVRSKDELGELAQAFNKMSAQLSRSVNARKQMTADI